MMRFVLDTNVLIPLEDSKHSLSEHLANFIRLANANGHELLYHPASEEDIRQDADTVRMKQTLQRLKQYTRLDYRPDCPWNDSKTNRNDAADNEILYSIYLNAAHALITEDKGIHAKAREKGLLQCVYTIQTAEDLLRRLHDSVSINLPNIEEVPLYRLTPVLSGSFFDSLRDGYPDFDKWFIEKAKEGRRAWISWESEGVLGGICIYARQSDEKVADGVVLSGAALKLSTFKVGDSSRGKKIGELFLKAAFRYATSNKLQNIFVHGDIDKHHFLFNMLEDFGFKMIGYDPGSKERDVVYVKKHPVVAPDDLIDPFEYSRLYFPHFRCDCNVNKYVVPIRPKYHRILFPDYNSEYDKQLALFSNTNFSGNAIKMAYLCHSHTKTIKPGDLVLFYRVDDEQAITSLGVVESYELVEDLNDVISKVRRRTVYSMIEIERMLKKPTQVMLFRLVGHFSKPLSFRWLESEHILNGWPQSIVKIDHVRFKRILNNGW